MRRFAASLCALAVFALGACVYTIDVRSVAVPDTVIAGRRTFRLLPASEFRGREQLLPNDPMLPNSSTYGAVREEIERAFVKRGYVASPSPADLDIAYYATSAQQLELRIFDYGYDWAELPREAAEETQFDRGTIVIDVVSPATHKLLWRGLARGHLDPNVNDYVADLRKTIDAIAEKFPAATR
ncbi:MAG: DUF4136 domain-containing protein [bacterium]